MFKYISAGLLAALLASSAYVLVLRNNVADKELALVVVTRERDNLKSELTTAQAQLAQSQEAQSVAAQSLIRAQAASRELAAIKDWIKGNEDAPMPAWFDDLLMRLGLGVR